MELVDTHCHMNFFSNAGDIALECEKRRVHTIYVTTLPSQFDETYLYVKDLKYVYPALGFHCLESDYNLELEKNIFLKNLKNTNFIGEIGLDFSRKTKQSFDKQINIFEFILNSIKGQDKILTVHSLNSEDKVLELLIKYTIKKAIFHWYTGKIGTLNQILNYGYYFSINESMCKSNKGQNIISKLSKERVLVETDAPFIKDVLPYNNYYTYQYLSRIWNMKLEDVKKQIFKNFVSINSNISKNSLFN